MKPRTASSVFGQRYKIYRHRRAVAHFVEKNTITAPRDYRTNTQRDQDDEVDPLGEQEFEEQMGIGFKRDQ